MTTDVTEHKLSNRFLLFRTFATDHTAGKSASAYLLFSSPPPRAGAVLYSAFAT